MPLYEFECRTCRERFEDLVRAADADMVVQCPTCGAKDAVRLLSAPAISLGNSAGKSGGSSCGGHGGFS
ncbi:MAG: FmdB family zinc ribbon protein [Myxococcales bacterium]|jgi:putative FmdB family regulatory protein